MCLFFSRVSLEEDFTAWTTGVETDWACSRSENVVTLRCVCHVASAWCICSFAELNQAHCRVWFSVFSYHNHGDFSLTVVLRVVLRIPHYVTASIKAGIAGCPERFFRPRCFAAHFSAHCCRHWGQGHEAHESCKMADRRLMDRAACLFSWFWDHASCSYWHGMISGLSIGGFLRLVRLLNVLESVIFNFHGNCRCFFGCFSRASGLLTTCQCDRYTRSI